MKNFGNILAAILFFAFAFTAFGDVTGKWTAEFDTPVGQQNYTFEFKANGAALTGTATSPRGTQDIKAGRVSGDEISFTEMIDIQGDQITIQYTGKVTGDELKLVRKVGDYGQTEAVAKRAK